MAGISDLPYRKLSRRYGATLAVSEMVHSDPTLHGHWKTQHRLRHDGEISPVSVQLVGTDPEAMAAAAKRNVELGADIIDINMGCPAKKVCRKYAGSALLADEALVARILESVVEAVEVPVTVKMRTGVRPECRNGVRIARIAENSGVKALFVHGRTRACRFRGHAEYSTIAQIKRAVRIPVVANGDIDNEHLAAKVLAATDADAVMIGRAALGKPWLFGRISAFLSGASFSEPGEFEKAQIVLQHCEELYSLYGNDSGARIARKHIRWYLENIEGGDRFWPSVNRVETAGNQLKELQNWFRSRDPLPRAA